MKTMFKPQFMTVMVLAFILLLAGCSKENNDLLKPNPNPDSKTYQIKVTPDNATTKERSIEITAKKGTDVTVKVTFQSKDYNMSRLYITKNEYGKALEPYKIPTTRTKGDGSIDVSKETDRKNITYDVPLYAPSTDNGTVVYTLWMTRNKGFTSRGDFREPSKRNAISETPAAVGTVVIKAGSGSTASGNGFKTFTKIILGAPLEDKSASSFLSIFDGRKYTLKQGEEFASFWDFGYYYLKTASVQATLSSAYEYRDDIVDIPTITKVPKEQLNHCYFKKSSKSVSDFDAIKSFDELEYISITKETKNEKIHNLDKNIIVEFIDQFGNKGILKVIDMEPGYGINGKIEFDVKVQQKQTIENPFKS